MNIIQNNSKSLHLISILKNAQYEYLETESLELLQIFISQIKKKASQNEMLFLLNIFK